MTLSDLKELFGATATFDLRHNSQMTLIDLVMAAGRIDAVIPGLKKKRKQDVKGW